MSATPIDVNAVLARYLAIQEQEHSLREEKTRLQERIAAHMQAAGQSVWHPEVAGQKLKVRCHKTTAIEYDEPVLKERLGERYCLILAPDLCKIRQNMGTVAEALQPLMGLVGSPAPDRVRAAIEKGLVKTDDFADAFTKRTRLLVAVARVRSGSTDAAEG